MTKAQSVGDAESDDDMTDEVTAIAGVRRQIKEMADGTLRISIDIEPRDKAMFHRLFPEIDLPVAIAPLEVGAPPKPKPEPNEYGDYARALRLSGFITLPETLAVLGTDGQFLDWLKQQPCAVTSECSDPAGYEHQGDVVAAHVRRIANGAGTGIKPEYSAIPLCDRHHQRQHQHGESAFPGGKEWFDKQRAKYLTAWAWERLKARLGVEHMYDASPKWIGDWAKQYGLFRDLPALIRHAAERVA